jgi:hypothetical protein
MTEPETHQMEHKLTPWVPRVINGGKEPPETEGDNWLAGLSVGTTFVARHQNSKDVDYNLYYVLFTFLPKLVLLKWQLPDGKILDYYVDPERFSRRFPDYVILGVDNEKEEPGEPGPEEDQDG